MSGEGTLSKKLSAMRTMPTIGTHNGTFHCDEVFACVMLRLLPEYKNAEIVRTRDQASLDTCDIVVDVGGVFDAEKNRFDHHQRTFCESMNSLNNDYKWTTKLSSAGLVYYHFGHKVLAQLLDTATDDELTKIVFSKVYERFVEEVDGIDNGINASASEPRYTIGTNLSSRVGHINPHWNESSDDEEMMKRFHKAMSVVEAEFVDRVKYYSTAWWPARELVRTALEKRHEVDTSGQIIVLEKGGCPWKEHLMNLEDEIKIDTHIKFVLYPDQSEKWRVQAVPINPNSFENRLSLLEKWRGLRDAELSDVSGIPGCIFVHASGFIGGNNTYEGALTMAKRTVKVGDCVHIHVKTTKGLLPTQAP